MSESHPLIDAIRTVQRRAVVSSFFRELNRYLAWSLVGLLLAAAVFAFKVVILSGAVLAAGALAAGVVVAWVRRPSAYDAACRLDEAAGLRDRISTAWHYATIEAPDEMIRHQRRDALGRLAHTDPRALFALRIPSGIGRTLVLAVAVASLLAYRTTHKPPLAVIAERLTPTALARAVQLFRRPDPERAGRERMARADERAADASDLNEDGLQPSPNGDREHPAASSAPNGKAASIVTDPSGSAEGPSEEGQQDASGQPENAKGSPNNGAGSESQTTSPPGDKDKDPSESGAGSQAGRPSAQSLGQRIQQALKDLLAKAVGEQPKGADGRQGASSEPATQPAPNARKLPPPPTSQTSKSPQTPGEGDSEPGGPGATLGANDPGQGDAPGGGQDHAIPLETTPNAPLETHPQQDVVPLSPTNFKGQVSIRTSNQIGTALVPFRDTSPLATASTNGAEQGDVPLRYRTYVQRYFNHPDEVRR
jgi:hypothetical protein